MGFFFRKKGRSQLNSKRTSDEVEGGGQVCFRFRRGGGVRLRPPRVPQWLWQRRRASGVCNGHRSLSRSRRAPLRPPALRRVFDPTMSGRRHAPSLRACPPRQVRRGHAHVGASAGVDRQSSSRSGQHCAHESAPASGGGRASSGVPPRACAGAAGRGGFGTRSNEWRGDGYGPTCVGPHPSPHDVLLVHSRTLALPGLRRHLLFDRT